MEGHLVPWLNGKLAEERSELEKRHRALVAELKIQCGGAMPLQVEKDHVAEQAVEPRMPTSNGGNTDASTHTDETATSDIEGNGDVHAGDFRAGIADKPPPGMRPSQEARWEREASPSRSHSFISKTAADREPPKSRLHSIVLSKKFEWFFAAAIVSNFIVMAIECQYIGIGVGYDLDFNGYTKPNTILWPGAADTFGILDYVFGSIYTVEVCLKIAGLRLSFFDCSNLFDAMIVCFWYLDKAAANVTLPIDMMLLRCLRLARLMRLLRLIKTISGFEQLYLMITALKGSLAMLSWTALLITMCLIAFAFLLNQTLVGYFIEGNSATHKQKQTAFRYFGTFSRSLFSMFELTLANWVPIGRFLMEDVSEYLVLFAVTYKLTFGFAVIAVINGCFIKETFKIADTDDLLMILQKEKEARLHTNKMKKLLAAIDASGDGMIDWKEWEMACHDREVKHWLGAQGLNANDAAMVFMLMDSGTKTISVDDLVKGVARLKGPASSLSFAIAMRAASQTELNIQRSVENVLSHAQHISSVLEGHIDYQRV